MGGDANGPGGTARVVRRLRIFRLRRSYKLISRLERKMINDKDALAARQAFAAETIRYSDAALKRQGIPRRERRKFQRGLTGSGR